MTLPGATTYTYSYTELNQIDRISRGASVIVMSAYDAARRLTTFTPINGTSGDIDLTWQPTYLSQAAMSSVFTEDSTLVESTMPGGRPTTSMGPGMARAPRRSTTA